MASSQEGDFVVYENSQCIITKHTQNSTQPDEFCLLNLDNGENYKVNYWDINKTNISMNSYADSTASEINIFDWNDSDFFYE